MPNNRRQVEVEDFVSHAEFRKHCDDNKVTGHKIDKLMPLAELIPVLQEIVNDEQSKRWLAKRVLNFLKIAGIVLGMMAATFGIIWQIIKEIRK